MTLTDAPKDFGGRLRRNCARTTPELPFQYRQRTALVQGALYRGYTMRSCDFAPDNPYFRATYFLSRSVNKGYLLPQIESKCQ